MSKKRAGLLQNLAIVLLSLSAGVLVLLMGAAELWGREGISQITQIFSGEPSRPDQVDGLSAAAVPVNLVLTNGYGRWGELLTTTASDSAVRCGSLLREAAGSSSHPAAVSDQAFRQALDGQGIFVDFLQAAPAQVAAAWFGASFDSDWPVRTLLLSAGSGDACVLLLRDGEGQTYRYDTAVPAADVLDFLAGIDTNGASFAYEAGAPYETLYPYTLLPAGRVSLPPLSAATPPDATDDRRLLGVLGFNTHTNYRYPEVDGTQVIVESPRTLRIRPDGTVHYSGDSEDSVPLLSIPAAKDEAPSAAGAALAALRLAEALWPPQFSGDGRFFLSGIQETAEGWRVSLGVCAGGVPVHYTDDTSAVEVQFTGGTVTAFSLRCRRYTFQEEAYALLPLAQAAAAAGDAEGGMLTVGYVDRFGEEAVPGWLLR